MPCYDSRNDSSYIQAEYQEKLDKLTRMLCSTLKQVEKAPISGHIHIDQETTNWWKEHKKVDAARAASRAEERRRRLLREEARQKLTPAERRLLGIG